MTSATPTRSATVRKQPTDRQPSKADRIASQEEPPVGHDLLKPVTSMRSGAIATAQADIMGVFEAMGIDLKNREVDPATGKPKAREQKIDASPATIKAMGRLGEVLEEYAVDKEAFAEFDSGPGSQTRVSDLGMWFLGRLGE